MKEVCPDASERAVDSSARARRPEGAEKYVRLPLAGGDRCVHWCDYHRRVQLSRTSAFYTLLTETERFWPVELVNTSAPVMLARTRTEPGQAEASSHAYRFFSVTPTPPV